MEEQSQQYGLASQLRAMRQFAEAKGYKVIEELSDDYSGGDLERPRLTRIRELVRARQVDVVVVHDPDRLSRELSHLLILEDEFERAGVKLVFVTMPPADTPEAKLLLHVKGVVAEYERGKIEVNP